MAVDRNSVILGSGLAYLAAYDPDDGIPGDEELETDANAVGRSKGGASLAYTPEVYTVTDDFGETVKSFITTEEVLLNMGWLTWDLENLAKLTPAVVTTGASEKVIKIGGAQNLSRYVVRFVHTKDNGYKLRVTIIGSATGGFELTFAGDSETTLDAQFTALSQDDGTLVEIRDQIAAVTP